MTRKILAIDGGGIKGVLPAAFLATMEADSGKSVVDHFDMIVGTSTGAIIALGLGLGVSASEILQFYLDRGPEIFDSVGPSGPWRRLAKTVRHAFASKYRPENLRESLEAVFGTRKLGESRCRLVIPSYDSLRRTVHVFKTAHHERLCNDFKQPVVDVALATAAAPTFFPAHKTSWGQLLVDGGVWANNPVGLAVVEAVGVLGWDGHDLSVLSLGCTDPTLSTPPDAGWLTLREKVASLLQQAQVSASLGTAQILTGHTSDAPKVYRVNVTVPDGTYSLDKVEQSGVLKGLGIAEARNFQPTFNRLFFDATVQPFEPCYEVGA